MARIVSGVPLAGTLALAFTVDRGGRTRAVRVLSDTTRAPNNAERARTELVRRIRRAIAAWTFGTQRGPSHVTLPIVFERD
jgi:hypothetical protein